MGLPAERLARQVRSLFLREYLKKRGYFPDKGNEEWCGWVASSEAPLWNHGCTGIEWEATAQDVGRASIERRVLTAELMTYLFLDSFTLASYGLVPPEHSGALWFQLQHMNG
jgi:hypothetical protein